MLTGLRRTGLVDWLLVTVSSVMVAIAWYLDVWSANALVALSFFVLGQWVIVLRHAGQEVRRQRAWSTGAGPVLKAVQASVQRHLLSVARNPDLEMAAETGPVAFKDHEFEDVTLRLLGKLAEEDFPSGNGEAHPLERRLVELRDEIMAPMRELARWGLIVERVYSAKDREQYSGRAMLLAVLEMVLTHYLAEIDAMLRTASEWPSAAPDAIRPNRIRFVVLEQNGGDVRLVSRSYLVPVSAIRLANALASMKETMRELDLIDKIPPLPVSEQFHPCDKDADRTEQRFCTEYLSLVWFRTLTVLLGEQLVSVKNRRAARRVGGQ